MVMLSATTKSQYGQPYYNSTARRPLSYLIISTFHLVIPVFPASLLQLLYAEMDGVSSRWKVENGGEGRFYCVSPRINTATDCTTTITTSSSSWEPNFGEEKV